MFTEKGENMTVELAWMLTLVAPLKSLSTSTVKWTSEVCPLRTVAFWPLNVRVIFFTLLMVAEL